MLNLIVNNPIISFIFLTFLISCIPFFIAIKLNLDLFNSTFGMILLILVVWSPNISAIFITYLEGGLSDFLYSQFKITKNITPWLISLTPLVVLFSFVLIKGAPTDFEHLNLKSVFLLLIINLFLGPLGEELGFRGFLLERLMGSMSPFLAALTVGVIWAVWHLPLWLIDSPQAKIPYWIFFLTVLFFSLTMTTIYLHSNGSIIPVVVFHLLVNVIVGWGEIVKLFPENMSYPILLPFYLVVAVVSALYLLVFS